jgi:hypothetical protein
MLTPSFGGGACEGRLLRSVFGVKAASADFGDDCDCGRSSEVEFPSLALV